MIRKLIGGALLACVLLVGAGSAAADATPTGAADVVPGVAIKETNGTITFTGGGFAPDVPLQLTINGSPRGTTHSTSVGAFAVPLTLSGVGAQSLSASGPGADGRVHVVTADVSIGRADLPAPRPPGSSTTREVYRGLAAGVAAVALAVLVFLATRLVGRAPAART